MTDDFGATTLVRQAMTFDEPLQEPSPATPTAPGPAWAGTLASAPASPSPPAQPPLVESPQSAAVALDAAVDPVDPTDFAATNLHQRASDVSVERPIDELSEHNRILAALPSREHSAGAAPSEAGDRKLMIALVFLASLIGVLVLVLLIASANALLGP